LNGRGAAHDNHAPANLMRPLRHFWPVLVVVVLAMFYTAGAAHHAETVNTARARADQSGYLWDAVGIHMMRHGSPDALIGERNRMPVYPWLLSWLYDPAYSPDEFFEVAKRWNIRASLVLLAVLALVVRRFLPALATVSFMLAIAFGYFVFKAGYAQVEVLFYTLFFVTFLACWRLLLATTWRSSLTFSALSGVLLALSQLTKASMLPFMAVVLAALAVRALVPLLRGADTGAALPRAGEAAVIVAVFLVVMFPYIANSKRVFGHWFYNVNSTFYVWYDDWPAASQGTYKDGDGKAWPTTPPDQIPSAGKYLREHSTGQIAGRFWRGFREMFTVSYIRLWYFKVVVMYGLFALALLVSGRRAVVDLVRAEPALAAFLVLYALVYTAAVSFYQPISGTTLRMLLVHVAPFLFAVSRLAAAPGLRDLRWTVAGQPLGAAHFYLAVIVTMGLDVVFVLWPRLSAEFAGY
jgi:hypothetical protein